MLFCLYVPLWYTWLIVKKGEIMGRIWARVIKAEKIVLQYMLDGVGALSAAQFLDYIMQICKELDLETPIVLSKHLMHFEQFNSVKFLPSDFLQPVDFDHFILENVKM